MNYINKEHNNIQELYKDSLNYVLREGISAGLTLNSERVDFLIESIDFYFSDFFEKQELAIFIIPLIKETVLKIQWYLDNENDIATEVKKGKEVIDNVLTSIEKAKNKDEYIISKIDDLISKDIENQLIEEPHTKNDCLTGRAKVHKDHVHHDCNCLGNVKAKSPEEIKDIKERMAFRLDFDLGELIIKEVKKTIARVAGNTNISELNFGYSSSGFYAESRELTDMTLQIDDNKIIYSIALNIPRAAYEAFQQNLYLSE
ncbi:hypothetical protein [Providencia sp. PROV091]|uniref:hypothetical protein n=1 Tax=Providencia sp. PROV091 TaxID=2949807 RepID=UPI00234BEA51|nr:hypothetical protein [Providencia sp. PROV091]